jgi:glycosyltransferase involved in cell wall biosynthesis
MISGDFPPMVSGVGDYVDKLAAALHDAGAEVTVLTSVSTDPGDAVRKFPVHRTIDDWSLGNRRAILEACRGYDVVHLQYPAVRYGRSMMINLVPAMLRLSGWPVRTLMTVHDFRVMRWRWRARVAPMLWAADGLIHVDKNDWSWIRSWGVGDGRLHAHIPIAANATPVKVDDALRLRWRHELGLADDETAVAFFGILYPHKGLSELVGAIQDLRAQGRKVRLLALGDFDRQADYRAKLEQLLADPAVRWVQGAPLDEVSRCLHAADLAALPFHSGASTNRGSLLAALAHGLPTTTNGPATPPNFDGDFDVVLVPVKDRAALASSIGRLMDDPALRRRMRMSALRRSRTWAAIADETLDFYTRLTASSMKGAIA